MTTLTTTLGTVKLSNTNDITALTQSINACLFSTMLLTGAESLALATAVTYNIDTPQDIGDAIANIKINGRCYSDTIGDMYDFTEVLIESGLYTEDLVKTDKLITMLLATEKTYPTPANMVIGDAVRGVIRRRNYGNKGGMVQRAIHILEETQFNVDEFMFEVAKRVNKSITRDEQYVIDGCEELIRRGNVAVHSEFFADKRARLGQGDFHGPNGQASDMARALMNLHGVGMDYNVKSAIKVIRDEMEDMISIPLKEAMDMLLDVKSASKFIEAAVLLKRAGQGVGIDKAWSFVKAAKILVQLERGKKPYIGMAFGLDAKCSGPQLGALMTGDGKLAAACGFSKEKVDDAYELAIQSCESFGIHGFKRASIKKAYMEVFYGLASISFTEPDYLKSHDYAPEVVRIIKTIEVAQDSNDPFGDQAGIFHAAIEKSFGRMRQLRNTIKEAHIKGYDKETGDVIMRTNKETEYRAPDGFLINMKYKVYKDIDGFVTNKDDAPDVTVEYETGEGTITEVFEKFKFKTNEVALYDFARTGFVNFIQGTDAYLARLIITNLKNLKAQHIIGIHDCFRVNINDMIAGKLHRAIQFSYKTLLEKDDAIKAYFKGVTEAGSDLKVNLHASEDGTPIIYKELDYKGLVNDLANGLKGTGNSYFFAK